MTLIVGFKGGQAIDQYDPLGRQSFQKAYDLDIFVDKNQLRPVPLKFQSMPIPALAGQSSVLVKNSYLASNTKYYFAGSATIAAATNFVLWSTTALGATPTYLTAASGADPSPKSFLEEYKNGLFFGITTTLRRLDLTSNAVTTIGSVTTGISFLRNHRGLGMIYFIHNSGRTIGRYDNSTFSATRLTLDQDDEAIGIEEYGRWCIIGVRGKGSKSDRFLVWDGASTTVDDIYTLNSKGLQGFRMMGGVITYVNMSNNGANDVLELVEQTPGRSPRIIKSQPITLLAGANTIDPNAFATFESIFLYGLNGTAYSDIDLGIYAYGTPTENMAKYWALWRLVSTDVVTGVSISSIKHNGVSLIVTWGTTTGGAGTQHIDTITGSGFTLGVPATGKYESPIFPLNEEQPGKSGKINRITIPHKSMPTGCGFTVSVRHFGDYPWGSTVTPSPEVYQVLTTPEGSGGSVGKTQSTQNAAVTEIAGHELFKTARYAQLLIEVDEVMATSAPTLIFPLLIDTD